jgi:hypothetical protein
MDITNIPQTLIKGLEQKNTDQLVALSRVLNLVLGNYSNKLPPLWRKSNSKQLTI